jgi:hypothetical protein
LNSLLIDGNIFIGANYIGGGSARAKYFYATIDDGTTGHADGNVLTYCEGGVNAGLNQPVPGLITSAFSPHNPSSVPPITSGANVLWQLNSSPPAGLCTGAGSQWLVGCTDASGQTLGKCGPSGTIYDSNNHYVGGPSGTCGANNNSPCVQVGYNVTSPTYAGWGTTWTNYVGVSVAHASYQHGIIISNNYADTYSGAGYWNATNDASCPSSATVFIGNVNLVSGAAINRWSGNASSGC